LEWVISTGFVDSANASRVVRSPQCETSTAMPISFIAATTVAPKSLMPPSARSVEPEAIRFCVL
jgi:hypothetical protein